MPKYGVHYLVLDKTREEMSTSNRTDLQRIGNILKSERFAASLGAIGPDLFLWTPDYEFVDSLRDIVQIYRKVMGAIDDINEISETIENNIKDGVDPIINGIKAIPGVGDVFSLILDAAKFLEEMKEYFEESLGSIKAELLQFILIKRLGLDGSDPENTLARSLFQGLFQSSHQMGREESDWYWIEMLHYRKTGEFSKALIKNAETSGSNTQIAYAYAYATHCATDLVGHPYINTVSGSPFRINAQGHSTIESFIDQWAWINVKKGNNIRTELMSSLELSANMPDEIANLLAITIRQVFMDVAHPVRFLKNTKDVINLSGIEHGRDGFLTEIDIKTAYDFQYIVLDTLGGTKSFLRPVEPYPGADDDLADIISKEQLNLNEYPSSDNSFPEDIDHFLENIDHVINWTVVVCTKLSDVAITLANGIADRLNQLQTNPSLENIKNEIELYAYGMQCLTYEVYREIHQIIALTGLTYPEPDDVDFESPLARRLISLDGSFNEIRPKPLLKTPGQNHLDKKSYLSLVTTPGIDANNDYELFEQHPHEGKTTFMSSYLFEGFNTPDWFIDKIPLNLPLMRNFAQSDSPEQTIALQQQRESFGSAVNISILMAKNWQDGSADQDVAFCNWNLDGDRGYGYKTWEGVPFTVAKGETDGILKGFEKISIVENQDFSTWTNIIDKSESQNIFKAVFEREYYINNKKIGFGIISPLIISEDNIPSIYTTIDGLQKLASSWPDSVLAARLTPTGNEFLENFYFCNGLTTTPSAAARACIGLQITLKSAPSIREIYENIKIKLIHN